MGIERIGARAGVIEILKLHRADECELGPYGWVGFLV